MIEYVLCIVGVPIAVYAVKRFLVGGVRDEFDYPLTNCDVSMMEELLSDRKLKADSALESVVVYPVEVKQHV